MIEFIIVPSCRAAALIFGLFLLRYAFGNRISPAMRHAFWGLVPLALLPMGVPSAVSVYNLLPRFETAAEEEQLALTVKEPGVERSVTPGIFHDRSTTPVFFPEFAEYDVTAEPSGDYGCAFVPGSLESVDVTTGGLTPRRKNRFHA